MKISKYDIFFVIGIVLWVFETIHFGSNRTAQSGTEHLLDEVSMILMLYGFFCEMTKNATKNTHIHFERSSETSEKKYGPIGYAKRAIRNGDIVLQSDIMSKEEYENGNKA